MKATSKFLRAHGRELLIGIIGLGTLSLLLWFRLGSLTYGRAALVELNSQTGSISISDILGNPLNAPYTLLQYLVQLTGHHGVTSMRLISTVWAILAMVLFYFVARQWHSVRVATLATWLFISSAWFLHVARLATPDVLWLLAMAALLVIFSPNRDGRHNRLALPSLLAVLALLVYIPGMVWLVVISVVLQRKNISEAWQATRMTWLRIVSLVGLGALLAPLVWGLVRSPYLLRTWAGISDPMSSPRLMLNHFLGVPEHIFVHGAFDPVHWLGHLPVLSAFEIAMVIIGTYYYVSHLRAARSRLIMVLVIASWLLIGIGNMVTLTVLLPMVYLVVATGIAYLLRDWFRVFPRNPIARNLGIGLVMLAILLTSIYQTRSYFVAWHYSADTRAVYQEQL